MSDNATYIKRPATPLQRAQGSNVVKQPDQQDGQSPIAEMAAKLNNGAKAQQISTLQKKLAPENPRNSAPLQRRVLFKDLPDDKGNYFLRMGQTESIRSEIDSHLDEAQRGAIGWIASSTTRTIRFKTKNDFLGRLVNYIKTKFATLKAVVDNVKSRVRRNSGKFAYNYSDQDAAQIYDAARDRGIADNVTADLMYTGSRTRKPRTATVLIQEMANWQDVVLERGYPHRFDDEETFGDFSARLHALLDEKGLPHDDVRIQGSSLRSALAGDVDIAVMVTPAYFMGFMVGKYAGRFKYHDEHAEEAKRGQPVDFTTMSYRGFVEMGHQIIDKKGKIYKSTSNARKTAYVIVQGLISGKDNRLPDLKAVTVKFASEFPEQNVEAVSMVVKGGEFDMEPSMNI